MKATDTITALRKIVANWWMIFASGVLFVVLGIWIMSAPLQSYFTISLFFAGIITLAGLMELTFTLLNRKMLSSWPWYVAGGVVDVVVGGYLMTYPLVTMILLPIFFGLWMLFRGIVAVSHSIQLRHSHLWGTDWMLIIGIVIILLALLIIINPALGALNFLTWTSLSFIVSGIFRITLALRLYSFQKLRHG
ncbi:MAG: HdeD family acid-resistance protein [Mucilaginibacter sp.]